MTLQEARQIVQVLFDGGIVAEIRPSTTRPTAYMVRYQAHVDNRPVYFLNVREARAFLATR